MRTPILVVPALIFALAAGCKKGQPTVDDQGSGSTAATGSAKRLPTPMKPPRKTTTPFSTADFEKLTKITFPGYKYRLAEESEKLIDIRQTSEGRPKVGAIVIVKPCTDCTPMDLAQWQAKSDKLRAGLPESLRDRPDLTFEVGETTINGTKMIYTFALDTYWTGEAVGSNIGAFINSYTLYYNDGINQIRVVSAYADDSVKTKEDLANMMPRAQLEQVAAMMMGTYTSGW